MVVDMVLDCGLMERVVLVVLAAVVAVLQVAVILPVVGLQVKAIVEDRVLSTLEVAEVLFLRAGLLVAVLVSTRISFFVAPMLVMQAVAEVDIMDQLLMVVGLVGVTQMEQMVLQILAVVGEAQGMGRVHIKVVTVVLA
jgi:hypothetical protein